MGTSPGTDLRSILLSLDEMKELYLQNAANGLKSVRPRCLDGPFAPTNHVHALFVL
jgi:hypothetical protein